MPEVWPRLQLPGLQPQVQEGKRTCESMTAKREMMESSFSCCPRSSSAALSRPSTGCPAWLRTHTGATARRAAAGEKQVFSSCAQSCQQPHNGWRCD